jgi:1-deoxy-D-xylulose-5-phosphate synthase
LPGQKSADRYQDVFGRVLLDLAGKDPKVVGITPAMASGCGMSLLARERPQQFFDVGIEEEHAVTFSAGLAAGGMKPFCNIYSSFAQRAYDQVIHDVALQKLPVVICLDRAGLVGEDGGTHNGAFDLAAFRCIPDTIISAPRNELELKNLMYTAYLHDTGPFIIRYPRGLGEGVAWKDSPMQELPLGKAETLLEGDTVALVCLGPVANRAVEAAQDFPGRVGVYDFRFLKPLDHETLDLIAGRYSHILTLEDGSLKGGLYGAVCEHLACRPERPVIEGAGIPDAFTLHARQADQRRDCGLDKKGISDRIGKILAASKN